MGGRSLVTSHRELRTLAPKQRPYSRFIGHHPDSRRPNDLWRLCTANGNHATLESHFPSERPQVVVADETGGGNESCAVVRIVTRYVASLVTMDNDNQDTSSMMLQALRFSKLCCRKEQLGPILLCVPN